MEDQQPATGDLTEESPDSTSDRDVAEAEAAPLELEAPEAGLRRGISRKSRAVGYGLWAVANVVLSFLSAKSGNWNIAAAFSVSAILAAIRAAVLLSGKWRPATKWSVIAAAVAAALFVGSAAFAGAMMQPYLTERATVATKLRVARTAANAITTLWTYTPQNIDKLADRASQYLSGDFQAAYRKYLDALVAPNKQAQISNTTQVVGAAVESLSASDATAIVYTNSASTSPSTKDAPSLKYLSYRLVLQRDHARWLVTKMTTITSLDLTPKF